MFSFQREKGRVELQGLMRRVADLTSPNLIPLKGGIRSEDRYNRSLPVLMAPYEDGEALVGRAVLAVSKDLSDRGVSVICCQSCPETEVVVGMWLFTPHNDPDQTEPFFFVGQIRQCTEIGAGYWQVGIELKEIVKSKELRAKLNPLAHNLLPKVRQTDCAPV